MVVDYAEQTFSGMVLFTNVWCSMWFSQKKITDNDSYSNIKKRWTVSFIARSTVALACVVVLVVFSGQIFTTWKHVVSQAALWAVKSIGAKVWDPMKTDTFGNINVIIGWYGWGNHDGGLLMDTIMVASYNQQLWAVTFISIPRDLYVNYGTWWGSWRINGVFWNHYLQNQKSFAHGITALKSKAEEITWLIIPYHMIIDFDGLVRLIDELWWVKVFANQAIYDTMYPWPNHSYQLFALQPWEQILDGETALKYARSRYSTSDFSRALRQQQIIQWMVQAIIGKVSITNPQAIKDWYNKFVAVLDTNITFKEVMWLTPTMADEKHFFSFVYTLECSKTQPRLMQPWCVLYNPRRELFWWWSVILPIGATVNNVSYYVHTQDFASWVAHRQEHLKEKAQIALLNGIDRKVVKEKWKSMPSLANPIGVEMVGRWFLITRTENSETPHNSTTLYVRWREESYPATRAALSIFVDIAQINYVYVLPETGERNDPQWAAILWDETIAVVFGNDYLDK
jgi:LCP family protein required for cell wall assembly